MTFQEDINEEFKRGFDNWHAFTEIDEKGNACVIMQSGNDPDVWELYKMVEHDIKDLPEMVLQLQAYLDEAQAACVERNAG